MSNILTAPQVDCCISVYGSRSHRITVLDDESQALCDKLFAAMEEIEPRKDGKVRELWVRANRCILRRSAATGAVTSGHLAAQRPPVIRWSF